MTQWMPAITRCLDGSLFTSGSGSGAANSIWADKGCFSSLQVRYTRVNNNPSQVAVARKVAVIEGAEAALVTASGLGSITSTLLTLVRAGDHVLVQVGA